MIDRRSLIALGMSAPVAGRSLRLDEPDPRIHPVNTGGVRVVGISPDASLLMGTRDQDTICILDANTRETISESDTIPNLGLLDIPTISWSPDGSHLAMSTRPWDVLQDANILMMNVASGEVTNLTQEKGKEANESLLEVEQANVDTNPVWLDNDRILFSRHSFIDKDIQTKLTLLTPSDGATETWVDLTPFDVLYVTSPIWKRPDGTVVFGTDGRRNDRNVNIAMMVSPDGTIEEIELGERGGIRVIDVNDTRLIAFDVQAFAYLYFPLNSSGEGGDLWEHFKLPAEYRLRSDPKLGPEPNTVLLIAEKNEDQFCVLSINESETTAIAEIYRSSGTMTVGWAEDVILVTSDDPAWLIDTNT